MLRLGAAWRKPRAPPSLWVVAAFLVTVALLFTSFQYCFIQSLVEVSREKEKQVPSTRGLAVTIPLSAGWRGCVGGGDPLQIRQRWCSDETLASFNSDDFRRDCCQGEARFETPRPLSKLLLLQLKVDKRMAPAAAHSSRAEKAWSGGRERRGRCCFVHSAVGCRSLSLPPPSRPGWRAWCLEPLQAGGAVLGRQGRWPGLSQPLSHCAGFTPGRLPLVLLLAEHLVRGETGSPGGFTTH